MVLAVLVFAFAFPLQSQTLVSDRDAIVPTAEKITGSAYRFESKSIGESRTVLIALPKSFAKTQRTYPVLFVLDGEGQFPTATTVASTLASLGHMPEVIVVGIPNTNRLRDLTPPGLSVSGSSKSEGGERFLDFLEKELMAALKAQFRANGMIVLEGHSSGGILATYAAATRPAFRFILALDTPVWLGENWLVARLGDRVRSRAPGQLRYVALDARYGWPDSLWTTFSKTVPATWQVERTKLDHESHNSMVFVGLYLGLRTLFEDFAIVGAPQSPTTATLAHYRDLERSYGVPVIPPSGLLRRVLEDLEMEGQSVAAADAWKLLLTGYGAPSDSTEWLARLEKLSKQPPLTETVESLLATPPPSTTSARHLVGEWRGKEWIAEEDKHDVVLRLRDSSGVVVGEWLSYPAPGVELVQKLTHIKLVPGGFDWGFMNGMRPRGMLIHETRVSGDKAEGTMRFGGIRFQPPKEFGPPPVVRFELTRSVSAK